MWYDPVKPVVIREVNAYGCEKALGLLPGAFVITAPSVLSKKGEREAANQGALA